jgi:hypothetical protein
MPQTPFLFIDAARDSRLMPTADVNRSDDERRRPDFPLDEQVL